MEAVAEWILNNLLLFSLFSIVIITYVIRKIVNKNQNLPPGPIGLPIVGSLPFTGRLNPEKICRLKKKYGGIFSLYLGNRLVVVLTDYPSVKEGLNNSSLLARPPDMTFDILDIFKSTKTGFGGKYWIEQRRFILHVLRDLGLGKNKLEEFITNEISFFIKKLKNLSGKPTYPKSILGHCISNTICSLIYGRRFEYDSHERKLINNLLDSASKYIGQTEIQIFIPWLKPIMRFTGIFGLRKVMTAAKKLYDFNNKEIEEHEKTLDPNNIRDYIDSYLIEIQKRGEDVNSYFSKNMMHQTMQLLLGAGSRTVSESLSWAFLIMAKYPSVQKKIQQEIDNVIGRHRKPTWADNLQLPYTQAVICEMQRWKTIIPINLLRYSIDDTMIQGYRIPKGTIIITNIWSVHNDVDYWKDPEMFRPERFFDETGKKLVRHDLYIPFGLGKMSCAGESMAKIELLLFFVTVMQQFSIKPPEGEVLDLKGTLHLAYFPNPQKLCFIER